MARRHRCDGGVKNTFETPVKRVLRWVPVCVSSLLPHALRAGQRVWEIARSVAIRVRPCHSAAPTYLAAARLQKESASCTCNETRALTCCAVGGGHCLTDSGSGHVADAERMHQRSVPMQTCRAACLRQRDPGRCAPYRLAAGTRRPHRAIAAPVLPLIGPPQWLLPPALRSAGWSRPSGSPSG